MPNIFWSFWRVFESSLVLEMANSDVEAGLTSSSRIPFTESDRANIKEALNDGSQLDNLTPLSLLDRARGRGVYMITALLSKDSVFQFPRNKVLPPASLQRQLFPFIENMFPGNSDWTAWIDTCMMSHSEEANRGRNRTGLYKRAIYPAVRLAILLVRLRRVVLQDYAAMMVEADNESGGRRRGGFVNEVAVKYPVLSSPAFLEYAAYLRKTMASSSIRLSRTPTMRRTTSDEEVRRFIGDQGRLVSNTQHQTADDSDDSLSSPVDVHSTQIRRGMRRSQRSQRPSTRTTNAQASTDAPTPMNYGVSGLSQQEVQTLLDTGASLKKDVQQLSSEQNHRGQNQNDLSVRSSSTIVPPATHSSTVVQEDDPSVLWQEIYRLREQLAVKDQEKGEAIEAATMAIEAAALAIEAEKSMESRMTEMERSMQGLWTMVARAEAERYAMGPRIKEAMGQLRRQDRQELLKEQLESFRRKVTTALAVEGNIDGSK
jgi:hypothetical protein